MIRKASVVVHRGITIALLLGAGSLAFVWVIMQLPREPQSPMRTWEMGPVELSWHSNPHISVQIGVAHLLVVVAYDDMVRLVRHYRVPLDRAPQSDYHRYRGFLLKREVFGPGATLFGHDAGLMTDHELTMDQFLHLIKTTSRCRTIAECPIWAPFVLFAAYPAIAFIRGPLRRWRRRKRGLCVKCGYDLTGNTTGVCSECGEAVGRV